MTSEFRFACRALAAQPGTALAVVFMAGLAIAANAALFSVFDGLLFRPLTYRSADRIVRLELDPSLATGSPEADDEAVARAETTPSLIERADVRPRLLFDVTGPAVTDWGLRPYGISPSTFDLLGVAPVLGRRFTDSDADSSPFSVLLGYDVWRTRFGGDASIVGRMIEIPGTALDERWNVVGVMPPGFAFPGGANLWTPIYPFYGSPRLHSFARLGPGVTLASVRAELFGVTVTPLREYLRPDGVFALGVLLAATALLLLVAWVHVSGLLFARAAGRLREIGVRLALGASRARLVRQFAVEAAVLMLVSLGVATLAAPALASLLVWMLPPEITLGQNVDPDVRAFGFATILSAIGIGLLTVLPADLVRRSSPVGLIRNEIFGGAQPRAARLRKALFVGQLGIASTLIYLAGLTLHSFIQVSNAPLGFDPTDLYAIRMPRGDSVITATGRERLDRQRDLVAATIRAIRELPGVAGVSGSHSWPMQASGLVDRLVVAESDSEQRPFPGRLTAIMPGYPAVLGVSLLDGVEPRVADLAATGVTPGSQQGSLPEPRPALVNETLAKNLEQFGPPVGQIVATTRSLRYRVDGVIPDLVLERADQAAGPTLFYYLPTPVAVAVVLARVEPNRTAEQVGMTTVLERLWGQSATRPFRVSDAVRQANVDYRARALILSLICILCVPLTMVGVAGALSYNTRQRTREIAIELALGAEPGAIERRIVKEAVAPAVFALVAGLAVGVAIGRIVSSVLFEIGAMDTAAIAGSAVCVIASAWISALLPARRAGRISPAEALRHW